MMISPTLPDMTFDDVMTLSGDVYRQLESRCTIKVVMQGHSYFVKKHYGTGWKEILKNLLQLRLPVLGAKNEWRAIEKLKQLGVAVPEAVGYGCRGINPASLQSFIVTRELPPHISLEDYCQHWRSKPPLVGEKRRLIAEVARIARTLHENGINHRDLYICHFLLAEEALYLIDLHRAQIRKKTPTRWMIKDLAGLYFSSKDIGLTQRDLLRFIREYRKKSLRTLLNKEAAFWLKVKKRGDRLYQKHAS